MLDPPRDRVRELQRALYRAAKADPERRFHALYDKVYRRDVLQRAWTQIVVQQATEAGDQVEVKLRPRSAAEWQIGGAVSKLPAGVVVLCHPRHFGGLAEQLRRLLRVAAGDVATGLQQDLVGCEW